MADSRVEGMPYCGPSYWHTTEDNPINKKEKEIAIPDEPPDDGTGSVSKITVKLQDIQDAHIRIRNNVVFTPLLEAKHVGKKKYHVYFKCENLQHTGSFKARGACNVLSLLSATERSKGCLVTGGRNFLSAMTHFGYQLSVPINVVISKECSIADRQCFKENFAIVKIHGNDKNEASLNALAYANEIDAKYIHGTDRVDLIAGYGTLGLELLTQLDKLDAIICPVASGSLIAGIIVAVKTLKPNCLIYGVECSASPVMTRALQEKVPVMVQAHPTIADGLTTMIASKKAFHIIRGYLDRMITVEETWIAKSMIMLLEREKLMVEGAGACAVAAILADKVNELHGKNVVCILTGGNINSTQMSRVIDRGLAAEGRLVKFTTTLPDVPGAMAKLLSKLSEAGVDIRSLVPERTWMKRDIFTVSVNMMLETANIVHSQELRKKLLKDYPNSYFIMI